jgi:hypothetical protein
MTLHVFEGQLCKISAYILAFYESEFMSYIKAMCVNDENINDIFHPCFTSFFYIIFIQES